MKYKKLTDDNANYLALVSHYPDYEKSELKNGGYATVTYVYFRRTARLKFYFSKYLSMKLSTVFQ